MPRPPTQVRLQKFLADAGIASRRKSEELIVQGKVSVNGKVVKELGTKVHPTKDKVTINKNRVMAQEKLWVVLNKPPETLCTTSDPEGRKTVMDLLPLQKWNTRLYPVGRLDFHTSGVLLLTNDGDFAQLLAHPKNQVPRKYRVKVKGTLSVDQLTKLREGVLIQTGSEDHPSPTRRKVKADVSDISATEKNSWITMVIRQGIHHQIHRMIEAVGSQVLRLERVSFGPITVDGVREGRYRILDPDEVKRFKREIALQNSVKAEPGL